MSPDISELLKVLAPTLSAGFAFLSAIAALVSYVVNRRNLSAKFLDRVYELDKLILSNPGTYELLRSNTNLGNPEQGLLRLSRQE